jgi:hypothetical protein
MQKGRKCVKKYKGIKKERRKEQKETQGEHIKER